MILILIAKTFLNKVYSEKYFCANIMILCVFLYYKYHYIFVSCTT